MKGFTKQYALKKRTGFVFLLLLSVSSFAQIANFTWAKNVARGTGYGTSEKISIDAADNVYLVGTFNGTIDVDPGPLNVSLVSAGSSDVFVSKFNSSGTLQWAKQIGGTSFEGGKDIKLDPSGNIYVCGQTYGITDLDPGAGTSTVSGNTNGSGFITKLDNSGNFLWGKALIGSGQSLFNSIEIDPSGNLFSTGTFDNITDFDPGAPTFTMTSNGGSDAFILKLNNAGTFQWAKSVGGSATDYGVSVRCDASGNPIILGDFSSSTMDFDPGPSTFTMSCNGNYEIYLLKLDALGNFMWAKQMGGSGNDVSTGLTIDASGNIFCTGGFYSTDADFDPGATSYTLAAGSFDEEVFCVKLDQAGNFVWANKFGGNSIDRSYDIAVDNTSGVYLTGRFQGTADFDPGLISYTISAIGQQDIFISRLNSSNGSFVWAKSFGSINSERGNCVIVNATGDVFSCGYFYSGSAVDFDPGPATLNLTSLGLEDAYIHKMSQCDPPLLPTNTSSGLSLCDGNFATLSATGTGTLNWYNLPTSGTLLTTGNSYSTTTLTAGTYTYYVEALNTCTTSLSRLPVTVTVFPNPTLSVVSSASVICAGESATLSASGANSYSWSTGGSSSNIVISPTISTTYTITGAANGCNGSAVLYQSVSACTGINELNTNILQFNSYPNPNNGILIVDIQEPCKLTLTDAIGKIIIVKSLVAGQNEIDITNHAAGIYFINIQSKDKKNNFKIIKH
ncbi:MAG: T9SS type A sorting domain-containing protein [Bacteroidia bacterium]|nr:T9SS type A sorting domain-containing protein [Bacteroidia bacterium]